MESIRRGYGGITMKSRGNLGAGIRLKPAFRRRTSMIIATSSGAWPVGMLDFGGFTRAY
jgi:hypothetical protein